jgi:hypothetical protein
VRLVCGNNTSTSIILTAILGNVLRQADKIKVPVPTMRAVYHTLLEMNRRIRESAEAPSALDALLLDRGMNGHAVQLYA